MDTDHPPVCIRGRCCVGINSDFGIDQVGVGRARLLGYGDVDGAIPHLQAQCHAAGILDDPMNRAFHLHPLGVVSAGLEVGKPDSRRIRRKRSAAQDSKHRVADDWTEAARSAHPTHVQQGSYEERIGRLARYLAEQLDKDSAGGIVNEDRWLALAKVRIEVGNNPAKMDREAKHGVFVAEAVRFPCRCENARPSLSLVCGFGTRRRSHGARCSREKKSEEKVRRRQQRTSTCKQHARLVRRWLANLTHVHSLVANLLLL